MGAGPVGLAAALALAEQGISCRIVDINLSPVKLTKASGTHPRTLETLPRRVVKDVMSRSVPVVAARLYEKSGAQPAKMVMSLNMQRKSDTFTGISAMEQWLGTPRDSNPVE